jgi:hypothetical protein
MTFFPTPCFDLIKGFAGIHPAKFHHKKVATMMAAYIEYFREEYDHHESIPLIYEIKFTAEWLEDTEHLCDRIPFRQTWEDTRNKHDNFCYTYSFDLYLIQWNKVYTKPVEQLGWLKLTTKPDMPRNLDGGYSYGWTPASCYTFTHTELQQFCDVNKIPLAPCSNLTTQEMISIILGHHFDE